MRKSILQTATRTMEQAIAALPDKEKRDKLTEQINGHAPQARAVAQIASTLFDGAIRFLNSGHEAWPPGMVTYQKVDPVSQAAEWLRRLGLEWIHNDAARELLRGVDARIFAEVCQYEGMANPKPFSLPDIVRMEHHFIFAPSGSGKTTTMQALLAEDFKKAACGECTVIVMDSEDELIPSLARLSVFAPGGALAGKLTLLDPTAEYPLSLNPFDNSRLSGTKDEELEASKETIENIAYLLSNVNDFQEGLLAFLVQLCCAIPNATLDTMIDLLTIPGFKKHQKWVADLPEYAQRFFATTFVSDPTFKATQAAVHRRLELALAYQMFPRIFFNAENKFDMRKELRPGQVILINTKKRLLGEQGVQFLGRYFLGQLMQASFHRDQTSRPVFCYVDECHDYIANDEGIAHFLDRARKRNVGMIFATQRMANIKSAAVQDALMKVAIRFIATENQERRGLFDCFVRRVTTDGPVGLRVEPPPLQPDMSATEMRKLVAEMRRRYCVTPDRETAEEVVDEPGPQAEPQQNAPWTEPPLKQPDSGWDFLWNWAEFKRPEPPSTEARAAQLLLEGPKAQPEPASEQQQTRKQKPKRKPPDDPAAASPER